MRYIWQHIKTIVQTYKGDIPLSHFLKNYFKQYPILGSRDRKLLTSMAYSWYRSSKGLEKLETGFEEKIKICLQVCNTEVNFSPLSLPQENELAAQEINLNALFPFEIKLSGGINREDWLLSMLTQPALFI